MASTKPVHPSEQEVDTLGQLRDIRPTLTKLRDWMRIPQNCIVTMIFMCGTAAMFPAVGNWTFFLGVTLFLWALTRKEEVPLKLPVQSKLPDPHQPHPATGAPMKAEGIFLLGNHIRTGKEIWLTNSDCRQHFLVLGTTGAGKPIPLSGSVHTPHGWQTMGDIKAGDLVSTPDGICGAVTGYFEKGVLDICRLVFEDERSAEACPEHVWKVLVLPSAWKKGGAYPVEASRLLSTEDLSRGLSEGERYAVAPTRAVEMPKARLFAPPRSLALRVADRDESDMVANAVSALSRGSILQRRAFLTALASEANDAVTSGDVVGLRRDVADAVAEAARSLGGVAFSGVDGERASVRFEVPGEDAVAPPLELVRVDMNVRREESACIFVDHRDHLFLTGDYVPTHNTEALLGFAANALSWGSGFLFCDGKGDVSLFAKVYAMARRFGREDDLLVLNFMNGGKKLGKATVRSNTLNPFSTGSDATLTQMVVSLMDETGGEGGLWKGRATAMLTGVMFCLVWLRDQGLLDLNVSEIRDHMNLRRIIELADEQKYPDIPTKYRKAITSYLTSLPGYQPEKREKQAQTTLDQHGYLEMQFTKILANLADVYEHIFNTEFGEVDMHDVVLNRRLLVVMLPALENSADEVENLGKIVVANLKSMMGGTLGATLEGTWEDVVDNRPTNSPSPFLVILDEVGYYTVEGMALMAAQARSLGFSMIYASQDIPAMKRRNEKEADSIIANTNTKIFMRTEEVANTGKLAVETGDKMTRVRTSGYERQIGGMGSGYSEGTGANFEDVDRIRFRKLKGQKEGEMTITFQEEVVEAKGIYVNPENAIDRDPKRFILTANHFIKVAKPSRQDMDLQTRIPEMIEKLTSAGFAEQLRREENERLSGIEMEADANNELALAVRAMDRMMAAKQKPIGASCAAIASVSEAMTSGDAEFLAENRDGFKRSASRSADVRSDMSRRGIPADLDMDDMEIMSPETGASPFEGFGMEEHEEPAKAARPRPPERRHQPTVDAAVKHGATVDDRSIEMAEKRLATVEPMMKVLNALHFDDERDPDEVDAEIEAAVSGGGAQGVFDAPVQRERIATAVDEFSRSTSDAGMVDHKPARTNKREEEDEEESGGGETEGLQLTAFLSELLGDADDE